MVSLLQFSNLPVFVLILELLKNAANQEVKTNEPDSPWKKVGVSPNRLSSIAYMGYKINIYEDMKSFEEKSTLNPNFYYSPLNILDLQIENKPQIVVTSKQNDRSIHFRVAIMNDSIREVIANLLSRQLKEQQVDVHQIKLFPFKGITLRSSQPVEESFSPESSILYNKVDKYVSFFIRCTSNEICINVTTRLTSDSIFLSKLHLTYDLGDAKSNHYKSVPLNAKIICETSSFSKFLKASTQKSELLITNYETDQLVSEIVSKLSEENFDFETEIVSYKSHSDLKSLLKDSGLFSESKEYFPFSDDYKTMWNAFEWINGEDDFLSANSAADFISGIYVSSESSNKLILSNFFSTPPTFDKPRKESLDKKFDDNVSISRSVRTFMPKKLTLIEAIEKAQNMVAWDGSNNFIPKVLNVRKIWLKPCRTRDIPVINVSLQYSKAFFTLPINHPLKVIVPENNSNTQNSSEIKNEESQKSTDTKKETTSSSNRTSSNARITNSPFSITSIPTFPSSKFTSSTSTSSPTSVQNEGIGCGKHINNEKMRTVGGKKADEGKWPWMAALLSDNKTEQFCGGVLISDQHILTASHCVDNIRSSSVRPEELSIRLGEYDFTKGTSNYHKDFDVETIYMHEAYNSLTFKNDVALIKLKRKVIFNARILPICLPPSDTDVEGQNAWVTGRWGRLGYKSRDKTQSSNFLLEVMLSVWKLSDCQQAHPLPINKKELCAGYKEDGKDSCQGDSGGPLMYLLSSGHWTIVGVFSWGYGCAEKNKPGVYVRVTEHLNWINAKLRK